MNDFLANVDVVKVRNTASLSGKKKNDRSNGCNRGFFFPISTPDTLINFISPENLSTATKFLLIFTLVNDTFI